MNSSSPKSPFPPGSPIGGLDPGEVIARALKTAQPSAGASAWTPPAPQELAALLPQYHIESLLGHGGMGAVYKGRQAALDRPVAIKLLPAEMAADPEFITRFQREARTLAKLQHPGIVAVYDFGQTAEGYLYFVMEFVDGTDLHRILHGPGTNPAQTLELVSQICDALHYAHGKGVIHRDIKPGNILVTTEGRAKLVDFGLARPVKDESRIVTGSNVILGTGDYMAPEQQEGRSDQRADIYALGVMLYEMLCGQRPRGIFEPPSRRVQVDVRLDEVVIKAMQQEPERRYQQVSEMKTDVDRIRSTPVEMPEGRRNADGGGRRAKKKVHHWTAAAVVAVCLALVSVAGFAIWKKTAQSAGSGSTKSDGGIVTLTPGEWFKIDLTSAPARGLATDGKLQAGHLLLQGKGASILVPPMRDGALRLRLRHAPKGLQFSVRSRDGSGLSVVIDGDKLTVLKPDGTVYGGTYGKQPLALPPDGTEFTLQFAHTGGSYVVCLGEKNVASGSIAIQPPTGTPELRAEGAEITALEVINLDNVPRDRWPEFARARERMFEAATAATPARRSESPLTAATKELPFANSLGMKFVPVPITGGPTGGQRVLFSVWETRVQDYEVFAAETRRAWPKPKFEQGPTHPAVNVSWEDAQAFCTWLTERERKAGGLDAAANYRLPSDHEWSCAVGIGDREDPTRTPLAKDGKTEVYPWGAWPPPEGAGNYSGEEAAGRETHTMQKILAGYRDQFPETAPVGSFAANQNGLYDLGGNATEWCDELVGIAGQPEGESRILRGASFSSGDRLLSSQRGGLNQAYRVVAHGFRCVLAPVVP